jgi:hypothetical protein
MPSVLADYVEESDLARELGCCRHTVARYRRQADGLPHLKVAGKVLFKRDDVAAWLEQRTVRKNPTRRER